MANKKTKLKLKILITGANGFVGQALIRRLSASKNYDIIAFVRDKNKAKNLTNLGATLVEGDITKPETLFGACKNCDIVVHLAAWVSDTGPMDIVEATNVGGTENVLQASVKNKIKKFIHMSSCAVYGSRQEMNIDEKVEPKLSGLIYHDSKIKAEQAVFKAIDEDNLNGIILRPPHIFGPESKHFTVRPIKMMLEGKLFMVGGGRFYFKPVYIDNLIDAVMLVLEKKKFLGRVYNISDEYVVSWKELFTRYATMLKYSKKIKNIPVPVAMAIGHLSEFWAKVFKKNPHITTRTVYALTSRNSYSSALARRELGWEPKIDFDEAMVRIKSWLDEVGIQ